MTHASSTHGLVAHYFRHEYGRLVAQLAHKVGVQHVELVEDAVQSALASALTAWVTNEVPREPGAWLYRAACNHLIGALRKRAGHARILESAFDAAPTDAVRALLQRRLRPGSRT